MSISAFPALVEVDSRVGLRRGLVGLVRALTMDEALGGSGALAQSVIHSAGTHNELSAIFSIIQSTTVGSRCARFDT